VKEKKEPMWKFFTALKELQEWAPWAAETTKRFREDLLKTVKTDSDGDSKLLTASGAIQDTLNEIERGFRLLDKDIRKAQGKRVSRD
jgi:hypothetical protein